MRKLIAAPLLAFALSAQATAPTNQPYTFDYFVHAESGPKPLLVFGTGKTTYIQLPDGVEVKQIIARKGGGDKVAEIFYSAPYIVVKEFHDSLKVVTNRGVFVAERTGAKTEVELAAERMESAKKEKEAAEAKAKEQAAEIAKLRNELKAKEEMAKAKEAEAEKAAHAAATYASVQAPVAQAKPNLAHIPSDKGGDSEASQEGQASSQRSVSEAAAPEPKQKANINNTAQTLNVIAGAPLSAIVGDFATSNNFTIAWNARERFPVANLKFEGQFESVVDEVARAFGLTAYMVGKTLMFVEAK